MQRGTMRDSKASPTRTACALMLALLLPAAAGATTKGPDAGGYTATNATVYSFVDIAGGSGGASVLADTDDGTAALRLPFSFRFYGQAYPFVCVSSNGALYFVADSAACSFNDFANVDVTSVTPPGDRPALMPLWSDLTFQVPGAGAVYYQTLGAAGNRTFVVEWKNAYPQGSPNPVTFQVLLAEVTGQILFQYRNVALGPGNPATKGGQATIGIRNAAALGTGAQIAWSFQAPVVEDESALLFSTATTDGPPVTTAALNGPAGSNGWYRGTVRVTLSATDAGGPVASTRYRIDGGALRRYSAPFQVSGDGTHSVSFFSIDGAGHSEAPKTVAIKIDGTAPSVSVKVAPATLWPANGKTVKVVVSGTIADGTSGIDPATLRYSVDDEYGQVEPSGSLTVSANGRYSVNVFLVASRKGNDRDGRTYKITVEAKDKAGNSERDKAVVTVPHDRDDDHGHGDHDDDHDHDRDRDHDGDHRD